MSDLGPWPKTASFEEDEIEAERRKEVRRSEMDVALSEGDVDYWLRKAAHFNVPAYALIAQALILRERNPHV